jgi:hypothetical protein
VAGLALRDSPAGGWRGWRRRWFCWEGGDRMGSGCCTLRRGARGVDRGRWSVLGARLPIDLVPGYRRPSTHYPLLPTGFRRKLRAGMAPREALSFRLLGKDFCPFDKPFDGPFDGLRVNSGRNSREAQGKIRRTWGRSRRREARSPYRNRVGPDRRQLESGG